MKTAKLYLFVFCLTPLLLSSSLASAQAPSTAQNFPAWTAISHKLEVTPLDAQVNRDAEVAIQELSASPDFHTPLCSSFFTFFSHLTATGYPYQVQIYRLYILGSATYRIETGKTDAYGTNLYAFTSVLKGYSALLAKDRSRRDKTMDDLLNTDLAGKLPERLKKDTTCN